MQHHITIIIFVCFVFIGQPCHLCFSQSSNMKCGSDQDLTKVDTMHFSVHPHLDAFWIYDFQTYFNPGSNLTVLQYFQRNNFHSVKKIFDSALRILDKSRKLREKGLFKTQEAHRSFFNSEIGFFKRWYSQATSKDKQKVKKILKTKYWQILGGGYVEHDEGCAYYDDIIENYQLGLHFLKEEFDYCPKIAIAADSFGHSQSTLAILAHIGIEGYFVERSDEHLLKQNKTQFIWKAKSTNGEYYGALPTHIRWAIHGFQDQFLHQKKGQKLVCQEKRTFIDNMIRQNKFLKKIMKSNHIMRYFGHDFQRFDEYSYDVIEGIMEQFAREKCGKTVAVYGNPTQYFKILMGEIFSKIKKVQFRTEDIMPIWDYDSGLYWTGYYTTDPFHKKKYRDIARYLHIIRKAFLPIFTADSLKQKENYQKLQELSEIVAYLQHHDGISGTSKYTIMDQYELEAEKKLQELKKTIISSMFQKQFPKEINNQTIDCNLESECRVPENIQGDIYLKVFKSGGLSQIIPIIVHLNENQYYEPQNCEYETNCLCTSLQCPCSLYIYQNFSTFSTIALKKVQKMAESANILEQIPQENRQISYNQTHIKIEHNSYKYTIGYKRLSGEKTSRQYQHLSRYGETQNKKFTINSGKYALGNDIQTQENFSKIRKVYQLSSKRLIKYLVLWQRQHMKTSISIDKSKPNQWKIETYSAARGGQLEDLYLEISAPHIKNQNKFYTDSNGWLVMKRQLYKHEDYQAFFSEKGFDNINGNSYPMTAFAYIEDVNDPQNKLSVNTDRPQGVIAYHPGTLWINYDRLSSDDGKWVFETTYRNQYQKFTHYITVDNKNNNERILQRKYDEPFLIEGHSIYENNIQTQIGSKEEEQQMRDLAGIKDIKFQVKAWNDSTTILRLHNLHDSAYKSVTLFSSNNICIFLSAFYSKSVSFTKITQTNMGGNIQYTKFLKQKWNWNNITNLTSENNIFNKKFGENIELRPLEIRTFVLEGIRISDEQQPIQQLIFKGQVISYDIDTQKQMPIRSQADKQNEVSIINYLLYEDHCETIPPVLTRHHQDHIEEKTQSKVESLEYLTDSEKQIYFKGVLQRIKEDIETDEESQMLQ